MRIKLDIGAFALSRAHSTDAGLDIRSPRDVWVPAHGNVVINSGVHVELPTGMVGLVESKSGLNVNHDITSTGVIDEGYGGAITVKLYNNGDCDYHIYKGDKISQLVIVPVVYEDVEVVDEINAGERGNAGFGSTGR